MRRPLFGRLGAAGRSPFSGRLRAALCTACLALAGPPVAATQPGDPARLLPPGFAGYAPLEPDGRYTADTLFDLIDGGAEVYRSFNVRIVVSRRYGRPGAPDITADIFDMGLSADAFGAYHHDLREEGGVGIGQESELAAGALAFWSDRYFVSIVAFDEAPAIQRAVLELGRAIASRIGRSGRAPAITRLPAGAGLRTEHLIYFHDWVYLNTRRFLADDNLLLLDRDTEGILVRCRGEAGAAAAERATGPKTAADAPFLLLLVRYPSEERARRALERFRAGHLPAADPEGVARRDDGRWAAAGRTGDLVAVVLEAGARPDMTGLLSSLARSRARLEKEER